MSVELTVNGSALMLDAEPSVVELLGRLDLPECGVAVAVNGVVRPRAEWDAPIANYAEVDVLTAVQGG
ncbi:MAG: sulfur carrier protein ThiS [Gordonia sp. (in: high G+C Gram-positive bacteria)]